MIKRRALRVPLDDRLGVEVHTTKLVVQLKHIGLVGAHRNCNDDMKRQGMRNSIKCPENKHKTQEMFFHIFNHLHQRGKQLILTSDRPPKELSGMEDRLISRFKWGLSADLQTPSLETRMAIIQQKLKKDGIELPHNVMEYVSFSVRTNIRELEGVLISLIAQAALNQREIDLE